MTVVVIVQARMGSTRLPGKVLLPIAGRPMLSYQLERLRRCRSVDRIIVATSGKPADEEIVAFCEQESTEVLCGPEHDVLERYALAAKFAQDFCAGPQYTLEWEAMATQKVRDATEEADRYECECGATPSRWVRG